MRGKMAFYSCFRAAKKNRRRRAWRWEGGCTLLLRVRDGVRGRGRDGRRTTSMRGSRASFHLMRLCGFKIEGDSSVFFTTYRPLFLQIPPHLLQIKPIVPPPSWANISAKEPPTVPYNQSILQTPPAFILPPNPEHRTEYNRHPEGSRAKPAVRRSRYFVYLPQSPPPV